MQSGDSLESLAVERLADLGEVMGANCLTRPGALPGSIIYLPPRPATLTLTITQTPTITRTPTLTLRPCDYPEGWIRYDLKPGDTLFKLGVRFHVSEVDLATGNCLSLDSALLPGEVLLVPEQPTSTPTPKK
jgi:LysM repeat protein